MLALQVETLEEPSVTDTVTTLTPRLEQLKLRFNPVLNENESGPQLSELKAATVDAAIDAVPAAERDIEDPEQTAFGAVTSTTLIMEIQVSRLIPPCCGVLFLVTIK